MPQENQIKVLIEFKRVATYREEKLIDKDEYEKLLEKNNEDLSAFGDTEEAHDIVESLFDLTDFFEIGDIEDFQIKDLTELPF